MKSLDLLGANRWLVVLGALSMSPFAMGCLAENATDDDEGGSREEEVGEVRQEVVVTLDSTIGAILAQKAAAATTAGNPPVGMAAAVVVNGQVFYNVWGNRKNNTTTPVQATDQFSMGSIAKPMTGEWIARKVDAGVLTFDTTIGDALPWIFAATGSTNAANHENATVEQLLSHTAGFAYQPTDHNPGNQYTSEPSIPQRRLLYVADAIEDPLLYPSSPLGVIPVYDGSQVIAAAMVEQLAGVQYEQDMVTSLYIPLGMANSTFDPLSSTTSVTGILNYSGDPPNNLPLVEQAPVDQHTQRSPVGGTQASIIDMGKFLNYVLTAHPNLRRTVGRSNSTMLGWAADMVNDANGLQLFHNGSNGTYYASAWVWPARGVAIVVAANSNNKAVVNGVFADISSNLVPVWGAPSSTFPQSSSPTYQLPSAQTTANSTLAGFGPNNAFDGNYMTWWVAAPGVSTPLSLTVALNGASSVSGAVLNETGPFPEPTQPTAKYVDRVVSAYSVKHYNLWLWNQTTSTWALADSGDFIGTNKVISFGTTYTNITKARLEIMSDQGPAISEFHLTP